MSKIAVIGAGFSGLSAAAYLAAAGHEVHVYEKNSTPGGRARQFTTDEGYVFDMGPSWYWMPDVFNRFFADFGYIPSDFYNLKLLNPSFEIVFADKQKISIPQNYDQLCRLFESIEQGSTERLEKFMLAAKLKYERGMGKLVYMPGLSIAEFADWGLIKDALRLQVFSSFSKHVRKYFSHPQLIALMEFPVLFLGAMPRQTPALYSLMNYAGLKLGTWYPKGGFGKVIQAMVNLAQIKGATLHCDCPVSEIVIREGKACGLVINGKEHACEAIVASADYHHVEMDLLPAAYCNYKPSYWAKKTFAPSCLIYYVGLNKNIKNLEHHTLFFEEDLLRHAEDIYQKPQWPTKPLFYLSCTSKSDDGVAPAGHENLFLLMPLAPGLEDNETLREKYFGIMMARIEKYVGEEILSHVDYKRSYCVSDFITDYHAYKGNAYGLANTLLQTAVLKPKLINKKIPNLVYAGQLTVPGPGVPPSLISGKIASGQLLNYFKKSAV